MVIPAGYLLVSTLGATVAIGAVLTPMCAGLLTVILAEYVSQLRRATDHRSPFG